MSEFQIYQFKSIDRLLTEEERAEIGKWSSRTTPSSNAATFSYAFGDFPKDEEKVMEQFFDLMLYTANWGTKRMMFRFPKDAVDPEVLSAYTFSLPDFMDYITLQEFPACYLLDIHFSNEDGEYWISEEDYSLDSLAPLREDILDGDYRSLYLVWKHFEESVLVYEEEEEYPVPSTLVPPPVPPNLSKLTPALRTFIEFFEISEEVVAAAKAVSPLKKQTDIDYSQRIALLPEAERNEWLLRLLNNEVRLAASFKKRLKDVR